VPLTVGGSTQEINNIFDMINGAIQAIVGHKSTDQIICLRTDSLILTENLSVPIQLFIIKLDEIEFKITIRCIWI
jgi:hypothetical protein